MIRFILAIHTSSPRLMEFKKFGNDLGMDGKIKVSTGGTYMFDFEPFGNQPAQCRADPT